MVLSLFPTLLDFALLGPVILRLAITIVFFIQSKTNLKQNRKAEAGLQTIIGVLLLIGLYTQGAALAGLVLIIRDFKKKQINSQLFILLLAILLSLLFLGPGLWAFDLPL